MKRKKFNYGPGWGQECKIVSVGKALTAERETEPSVDLVGGFMGPRIRAPQTLPFSGMPGPTVS